ncbi:hypothetical protein BJ912DRAFT_1144492 [Pholiota molesta]|nr:hypothetical protein BJ912DRAFT_1144492 [Pholiota molesta]
MRRCPAPVCDVPQERKAVPSARISSEFSRRHPLLDTEHLHSSATRRHQSRALRTRWRRDDDDGAMARRVLPTYGQETSPPTYKRHRRNTAPTDKEHPMDTEPHLIALVRDHLTPTTEKTNTKHPGHHQSLSTYTFNPRRAIATKPNASQIRRLGIDDEGAPCKRHGRRRRVPFDTRPSTRRRRARRGWVRADDITTIPQTPSAARGNDSPDQEPPTTRSTKPYPPEPYPPCALVLDDSPPSRRHPWQALGAEPVSRRPGGMSTGTAGAERTRRVWRHERDVASYRPRRRAPVVSVLPTASRVLAGGVPCGRDKWRAECRSLAALCRIRRGRAAMAKTTAAASRGRSATPTRDDDLAVHARPRPRPRRLRLPPTTARSRTSPIPARIRRLTIRDDGTVYKNHPRHASPSHVGGFRAIRAPWPCMATAVPGARDGAQGLASDRDAESATSVVGSVDAVGLARRQRARHGESVCHAAANVLSPLASLRPRSEPLPAVQFCTFAQIAALGTTCSTPDGAAGVAAAQDDGDRVRMSCEGDRGEDAAIASRITHRVLAGVVFFSLAVGLRSDPASRTSSARCSDDIDNLDDLPNEGNLVLKIPRRRRPPAQVSQTVCIYNNFKDLANTSSVHSPPHTLRADISPELTLPKLYPRLRPYLPERNT